MIKKTVYLLSVVLVISLLYNYKACTSTATKADTVTIERTDTMYITKTDTLPYVKKETVTHYIKVPVPKDSIIHDTINAEVVQRTYTNDSLYVAYVSGIRYNDYPRLDSISVMQRTIVLEKERIVTTKLPRRFRIGLQAGAGFGVFSRKPDVYIGVGGQISF